MSRNTSKFQSTFQPLIQVANQLKLVKLPTQFSIFFLKSSNLVEKKVPYPVHVPVERPYPVKGTCSLSFSPLSLLKSLISPSVYVPTPYEVIKKVPYPVHVPAPYPVVHEKKVPVEVAQN
jgi:hypothetical protein